MYTLKRKSQVAILAKKRYIFFACLLCSILSCEKSTLEDPLPTKINPNLQYFGYTLIDVGWDDPTDKETKTNYLDEVHHFSNVADILVVEPSDNIIDRLKQMDQVNVQGIIHLNEMFFEQKSIGGDKSGVIYGLRSDYQARWDEFVSTNNLTVNHPMINCFYIGEEPAWNGISEEDFTEVCDYVKATVPEVPILNVEAFAVIEEMYFPNSVDWVAFDHYFLQEPSTNNEYLKELNLLKTKKKNTQKIFLIMDAHWIKNFHGSSGIGKNDMDFIARDYYKMANTDTSIIGILNYFWPSGFDFKSSIGSRHLPKHVLDEHKMIGRTITGKG
ncbi:MAG: hypothetical protein MI810_20940 [Flavobacteriales bacterium]|nr:hypothetical protein [Flavobacteriales bacterium]